MKTEIQILWFKKDLRVIDHLPLVRACENKIPVLPIYLIEPSFWRQPFSSKRHWSFIRDCLIDLQIDLINLRSNLHVEIDEVLNFFDEINKKFKICSILSHEETGNNWVLSRNTQVQNWCKTKNINFIEYPNNGVVRNLDNRDKWSQIKKNRLNLPIVDKPNEINTLDYNFKFDLPSTNDFLFGTDEIFKVQKGGRKEALKIFDLFLKTNSANYLKYISGPNNSDKHCSRLSTHLTYGTISVREVFKKVNFFLNQNSSNLDKNRIKNIRAFTSRISWRCHFIQKLEDQPSIEFKSMHPNFDALTRHQNINDHFRSLEKGLTGYPFIDACMRSLTKIGWLNFRMRAMLVSFASYDLWLDWKNTGNLLAKLFTDYEPGIHYSQLQMQSGVTGINTFRIYNPVKQSIEHDNNGAFIKKWVPELKNLDSTFIHEPWKMDPTTQKNNNCILGKDYPNRIVIHEEAIKFARNEIKKILKTDNYYETSKKVFLKHGSRNRNTPRVNKKSKQLSLF